MEGEESLPCPVVLGSGGALRHRRGRYGTAGGERRARLPRGGLCALSQNQVPNAMGEVKPVSGAPQAPSARAVHGAGRGGSGPAGRAPFPTALCFPEPPPVPVFKPGTKQLPSHGWETRPWVDLAATRCGACSSPCVWVAQRGELGRNWAETRQKLGRNRAETAVPLLPGRLFLGFSSKPHSRASGFFWGLLRSSRRRIRAGRRWVAKRPGARGADLDAPPPSVPRLSPPAWLREAGQSEPHAWLPALLALARSLSVLGV